MLVLGQHRGGGVSGGGAGELQPEGVGVWCLPAPAPTSPLINSIKATPSVPLGPLTSSGAGIVLFQVFVVISLEEMGASWTVQKVKAEEGLNSK